MAQPRLASAAAVAMMRTPAATAGRVNQGLLRRGALQRAQQELSWLHAWRPCCAATPAMRWQRQVSGALLSELPCMLQLPLLSHHCMILWHSKGNGGDDASEALTGIALRGGLQHGSKDGVKAQ